MCMMFMVGADAQYTTISFKKNGIYDGDLGVKV